MRLKERIEFKDTVMEQNEVKGIKRFSSIFDVITLVFITLRACDVVSWKWWQVLMPEFIGIFLVITLVIGMVIGKAMKSVGEDS